MQRPRRRPTEACARRGAITVWMILAIPVLATLLCVVLELGNLWLARIELTNALESSSLAAVKEWADNGGGSTLGPRKVGNAYSMANTINGDVVDLLEVDDDAFPLNYDPAEACNENACSDGVLVFGAVSEEMVMGNWEFVFDCCETPACGCPGIRINAFKPDAGSDTFGRAFGIFYEENVGSTICSVTFTMPSFGVALPQQPYFDAQDATGQRPIVSNFDVSDSLNLFNLVPTPYDDFADSTLDVRGLDPDPVLADGPDPETSEYRAPGNVPPPPFTNLNGDVEFTFQDLIPFQSDRYRQVTIHFRPGTFEPPTIPGDSSTYEFLRFGVSYDQLNPPALPGGTQNDGDALGIAGVGITVVLCNGVICEGQFVDDGINNDFSPSTFDGVTGGGGGGGPGPIFNAFAVRAQATYEVPSICCELFGLPVGPFNVSAKADALYDCELLQPRLYHLEERNYHCNVVCP